MSYQRELPRDLYNEANLLKCMAKVIQWINDEMAPGLVYEHQTFCEPRELETPGFEIGSDGSGEIFVMNLNFQIGDQKIEFWRPHNSRSPWPLYFHVVEDEDAVLDCQDDDLVFTDEGEMSPEFHAIIYGD